MPPVGADSLNRSSNRKETCVPVPAAEKYTYVSDEGKRFSGHWIVEPGIEQRRQNITPLMNLPFNTTVHFIGVHLHPFAEYLELRDITADAIVYRADAANHSYKIGLHTIGSYSNKTGFPIYRDHEYELIYQANNTTNEDQDMMAVMILYMFDKDLGEKIGAFRKGVPGNR